MDHFVKTQEWPSLIYFFSHHFLVKAKYFGIRVIMFDAPLFVAGKYLFTDNLGNTGKLHAT